jgi:hypothetical protein
LIGKKFYIRKKETHNSLKGFSRISFTSKKNYQHILELIDRLNYDKQK